MPAPHPGAEVHADGTRTKSAPMRAERVRSRRSKGAPAIRSASPPPVRTAIALTLSRRQFFETERFGTAVDQRTLRPGRSPTRLILAPDGSDLFKFLASDGALDSSVATVMRNDQPSRRRSRPVIAPGRRPVRSRSARRWVRHGLDDATADVSGTLQCSPGTGTVLNAGADHTR